MDPRVQRLHASVEHLGEARDFLDGRDLQPGLAQGGGGPARGHERDTDLGESTRQLDHPGLVVDGEQGSSYLSDVRHDGPPVDRHLATVDADPSLDEGGGGGREQAVLDLVDASLQRIPVVVLTNLDGFLQNDRPGVHPVVDEEDGHASHLDAVRERVGHAVHARERGEERRVHVQPAATIRFEHRGTEQAHVPGRQDGVDPAIAEEVHHRPVEGLPPLEVLRPEHGGLDTVRFRPFERLHVRTVGEHERDPGTADGVIEEGLQVRPGTGNEHRDPLPHGRGTLPEGPSTQAVRYRRGSRGTGPRAITAAPGRGHDHSRAAGRATGGRGRRQQRAAARAVHPSSGQTGGRTMQRV